MSTCGEKRQFLAVCLPVKELHTIVCAFLSQQTVDMRITPLFLLRLKEPREKVSCVPTGHCGRRGPVEGYHSRREKEEEKRPVK